MSDDESNYVTSRHHRECSSLRSRPGRMNVRISGPCNCSAIEARKKENVLKQARVKKRAEDDQRRPEVKRRLLEKLGMTEEELQLLGILP